MKFIGIGSSSSAVTSVLLLAASTLLLILSFSSNTTCHAFQIGPLLSTCIDACQRGCDEIRHVQQRRQGDSLEVELKEGSNPRSALTVADMAAQKAIITSLREAWGDSLHIVGEEEEEEEDHDADEGSDKSTVTTNTGPLRMDLLENDIGETDELDPNDVTIFVDPLDGTREFVEGRLENCQVLVGIAIGGFEETELAGFLRLRLCGSVCEAGLEEHAVFLVVDHSIKLAEEFGTEKAVVVFVRASG